MKTFKSIFEQYNWDEIQSRIYKTTSKDVERTLAKTKYNLDDFLILISPVAQNYLEDYSIEKLIPKIEANLMELNDNPEGNPMVDFGKIDDKKFIINKIEVLNHRWIIADFSNGDLWGEVLLQYFIEEDESLNFKIIQSTLYPKQ